MLSNSLKSVDCKLSLGALPLDPLFFSPGSFEIISPLINTQSFKDADTIVWFFQHINVYFPTNDSL